jgi:uncharacterized delta-60 repeat protein
VAVGRCDGGGFALARFNPDGALDRDFGRGGRVRAEASALGARLSQARAVDLQADGGIVVAGTSSTDEGIAFVVVRFEADGDIDPSFGASVLEQARQIYTAVGPDQIRDFVRQTGVILLGFGSPSEANDLLVQDDGAIVAVGRYESSFAVARYLPNGSLDPSFGSAGRVTTDIRGRDSSDAAVAVTIEPSGKLVVAGVAPGRAVSDAPGFAVVRYQ